LDLSLMKHLFFLILIVSTFTSFAAAKIDYINVDGDLVYFSTLEAKTSASPSCVISDTQNLWSISLSTSSGRALYSLLATAVAGELAITVSSALDCMDTSGIERAKSIAIAPVSNAATGAGLTSGKSLYLYKGDGTWQSC
jgi:hypothetical protein